MSHHIDIARKDQYVNFSGHLQCFLTCIADMPHDTDYPYPIRILAVFLSDTAVLHFDTDFS